MRAIERIGKQFGDDVTAAIEGLRRDEHRRNVDGHLIAALVEGICPTRELQHREHVVRTLGAIDDVTADRLGAVTTTALEHGLENRERALAHGIEFDSRPDIASDEIAQPRMSRCGTHREPIGFA